jgi:hypothetical protein
MDRWISFAGHLDLFNWNIQPDKEKCEAFLRAQKNVAEKKRTKGVSPTAVFRSPSRPTGPVTF